MSHQLHLNAFLFGTGHHEASWRLPEAQPDKQLDLDYYIDIAKLAEKGLMDAVFIADGYVGKLNTLEPFTLLSAIATATKHIGLIGTCWTTHNEPFHIARMFASLDHISKGRAGWNIVTGGSYAADNFGNQSYPPHALRYDIAEEFIEVTKKLWDSWEDDAIVNHKEMGIRYDHRKIHSINFKGKYYEVKGPLTLGRPPQGYPVIVQSGSSESGKELAAKIAEVIYTAHQTIGSAQHFYKDVKSRMSKYGRLHEEMKVLPGICPIIGNTEKEAKELEQYLFQHLNIRDMRNRLSQQLGIDLSDFPLDEVIPIHELRKTEDINTNKSRHQLIIDLIEKEKLTLKQIIHRLSSGRGHFNFTGTPIQLADLMEKWLIEKAADGFNLLPPVYPSGLETFVNDVIPELQNRGIYRTSYEGTTLRDRLHLQKPAHSLHPIK